MIEFAREIAIGALLFGGVFFTLVSGIGLIRLPDIYTRSHLASETDTLGTGLTLAAVILALGFSMDAVIAILLLVFIYVTNPTAAHAIARAAHEDGIEPETGRLSNGREVRYDDS